MRGTKTEGAQEGGTNGYPSAALATVEMMQAASTCIDELMHERFDELRHFAEATYEVPIFF